MPPSAFFHAVVFEAHSSILGQIQRSREKSTGRKTNVVRWTFSAVFTLACCTFSFYDPLLLLLVTFTKLNFPDTRTAWVRASLSKRKLV